ncbi:MAG: shikimate kinase [Cellulosilyticum sp.]|nr:shikimate kinase [Cellulosilyticum sp.]
MRICLIGFMGSGKTTIGRSLSERLNLRWIDLDQYIEKKSNQSISDIFEKYGEAYFRRLEQGALNELLIQDELVISTGGGIITTPDNRVVLKNEISIYLEYPFETLYERIAGDSNRPLATSYESLKERFTSRLDLYEQSSQVRINCQEKSVNEITQEILTCLETIS